MAGNHRESRWAKLYELTVNEEDARACRDISDSACRVVPANFLKQWLAMVMTKTGDALVNAKTVLTWLMTVLGAPVGMIGWLVPLRESLSMLPQLVIAGRIRRMARRKPVWLLGAGLQGVAVAGLAAVALTMTGALAGAALLGCLIVFSLARGLCSVASKDILGKTVPKGNRGRLTGWASGVSGAITVLLGAGALVWLQEVEDAVWFVWPLAAAALLWWLSMAVYGLVEETPGETGGGANALAAAVKSLSLFKTDPPFRRFVVTRALLLCSALSAPYYLVLARDAEHTAVSTLGGFVLAGGLASALSAPCWGWMADRSSRLVLQCAGALTALLGVAVFLWERSGMGAGMWTYPAAYFLLSIAHSGVRVGRKTYVVDLAGGNKRTDYVAVSNSAIGLVLLIAGGIGTLAEILSPEGIILILSMLGLGGVFMAFRLP